MSGSGSAASDSGAAPVSLWVAAALGFVGFVTSFGAHIVAVNLPSYARQVGVGLAMIGVLIAAYDLAEIVAKPVFGAIADRRGMKQTMLVGIVVFTAASFTFPFIDPRLLLVVRFAQGVGAAALSAVSLALIGAFYPQRRGQAYGVYNAIKGLGYVTAPIVGGAIVVTSSFEAIFYATGAVGCVAFVISAWLPDPDVDASLDDEEDELTLAGFLAVFRAPRLLPWYGVTVINMFLVGILFGFLPVRVHALGYGPLASGVLLTAVSASYVAIQPAAGRLADRLDVALTIRAGLALAASATIAMALVTGPLLVGSAIAAGLGVGVVWTNTDTLISDLAATGRLGSTMGAAGSFKEFGDMVGPLLVGALSQAFGLTVGFVTCGGIGLACLALLGRVPPITRPAGAPDVLP